MLFVRFFHYLGIALWIGGWLAVVVVASGSRGEPVQAKVSISALLARVHTVVIAPGMLLSLGSGILWSMAIASGGAVESRVAPLGTWVMTGLGVVGGLIVAVVALPAALKLRAVAISGPDGRVLPVFDSQWRRLQIASAAAGVCALASLLAAAFAL